MKKLLWLDDYRNPLVDNWLSYSPIEQPYEVFWVKDASEFKQWINVNQLPDAICFDHDLGEDESGFDCAKWLVEYCMDNSLKLPKYKIQSANPVGKDNIDGLFKSFIKSGQVF
ncbi:hypothetical protein BH10BAC1_BH10BAC1_11570 [soil metagenome]